MPSAEVKIPSVKVIVKRFEEIQEYFFSYLAFLSNLNFYLFMDRYTLEIHDRLSHLFISNFQVSPECYPTN
jgi:hypothetical protein